MDEEIFAQNVWGFPNSQIALKNSKKQLKNFLIDKKLQNESKLSKIYKIWNNFSANKLDENKLVEFEKFGESWEEKRIKNRLKNWKKNSKNREIWPKNRRKLAEKLDKETASWRKNGSKI